MNRNFLFKKEMSCFRKCSRITLPVLLIVLCLYSLSACVSHLKEAKFNYTQAQKFSRLYQTEKAIAYFKRTLREAEKEVEKHPSAQGYMLKGMAELSLKKWEKAEESFLNAFSYGFEKGEDWARQLSLFGLASSMEELGLENSALRIYSNLIQKSKLKPVTVSAAQKYSSIMLRRALRKEEKERKKMLAVVLKAVEKLAEKDLSCGFYHYLQSQILSHLSDYKRSFEEAVMARELGLPTQEIFRDNDLQIIFCYQRLKVKLSPEEWEEFRARYMKWVKRWNWKDPEIPGWKKETDHAAGN